MPRRNAVLPLVAVAALGLVTGCEKQSPWVTLHADGVVVKARATKYCRPGDAEHECNKSSEKPVLKVKAGSVLGIDVPRSVAENGWRVGEQGEFRHDHYFALPIPADAPPGAEQDLTVVRDPRHGEGVWTFHITVK